MKIITKNFGEIEFEESKVIEFEEGIPGFRELKKYIIVEDEDSAFLYLQSIETDDVSFIMINPYELKDDYEIHIKDQYVEALGGGDEEAFNIYVIATIIKDLNDATVNLVAPILIQNKTNKGMQIILETTKYTTRHRIVDLLQERGC